MNALSKGPGKRGHIVADTLLLMMFLGLRKLGNICCGHKMFLNKIRNIFVSRTQNLCPQQMLRTRTNGETFVSATMCPQQCVLVCQDLNEKRPASMAFYIRPTGTQISRGFKVHNVITCESKVQVVVSLGS